jgi:four helix bundle protein
MPEIMPRDIRRTDVSRLSDDLVFRTYALTADLPDSERFGLLPQTRRAAVSVPVNLVEGAERESDKDFSRFLEIAGGSASEVRYLLSLSRRLGFTDPAATALVEDGYDHVVRSLHKFRRGLRGRGGDR